MPNSNQLPQKVTSLISCLRGKPTFEIISAVNTFVNNHIEWVPDPILYRVKDYWAAPSQTMQHKAGDCEDIAILKYWMLTRLGQKPVFWYTKVKQTGQAHIVCVCDGHVLDTQHINPLVIRKALRDDLAFGYKFNSKRLWAKGRTYAIADISMTKFKSMLGRMA